VLGEIGFVWATIVGDRGDNLDQMIQVDGESKQSEALFYTSGWMDSPDRPLTSFRNDQENWGLYFGHSSTPANSNSAMCLSIPDIGKGRRFKQFWFHFDISHNKWLTRSSGRSGGQPWAASSQCYRRLTSVGLLPIRQIWIKNLTIWIGLLWSFFLLFDSSLNYLDWIPNCLVHFTSLSFPSHHCSLSV
jgi:hypothetical protein